MPVPKISHCSVLNSTQIEFMTVQL
uniref:Uncharacterized protein n=1 Tax=Anguilla anguilla TaxID=7936 RepID=A0A0E9T853_ANGAN